MASIKLHHKHNVVPKKEREKSKTADAVMDKTCQTNQANLDGTTKEKIVILPAPDDDIPTKMSPTNLTQQQRPIPKPKHRSCPVAAKHVASTPAPRHHDFDGIEISLAKITSSQRAICTSIDSLV